MFSTCSELTPRAPIPDGRMERIMQPCGKDDEVCMDWGGGRGGAYGDRGPFLLDALMHTFAPWHCSYTCVFHIVEQCSR